MLSFLPQQVILYEEEMGNHSNNTGEKLILAEEQLALAGDRILSLERSLNLYRDKYQASLSNIELLECQVKMLEGELSGLANQVGLEPCGLALENTQRCAQLVSFVSSPLPPDTTFHPDVFPSHEYCSSRPLCFLLFVS